MVEILTTPRVFMRQACANMENSEVVREFVEEAKLTEQSHKELAVRTAKVEMDRDHIRKVSWCSL